MAVALESASRDSSELFFGDIYTDCHFCGKECKGPYCSQVCQISDHSAAAAPTADDDSLPPLPALTSGYSQSSTSSQCSTPEVSPFTKPDRSDDQEEIAVLELGEALGHCSPQTLSRSLRSNLNFDYSYKLDAEIEHLSSSGDESNNPSPKSLSKTGSRPSSYSERQHAFHIGKTPTHSDDLRLRRTPLQNPTLPRKATTNLLSPVLGPQNSPQLKPKAGAAKPTKVKRNSAEAAASSSSGGCGKPGCASGSDRATMVRRASAPLTALRSLQPMSTVDKESAIQSSSSSDDESEAEAAARPASNSSRGRSRGASRYAASDRRGRTKVRVAKTEKSDRRADSAHAPSGHGGAPICLQKDPCIHARPLSDELQRLKEQRTTAALALDYPMTRVISNQGASTNGSRPRNQFYGRARPSFLDQAQAQQSALVEDTSNDDLESTNFALGSPAVKPAELAAEDEAEDERPARRGRRSTHSRVIVDESLAQDEQRRRGRSRARNSSATAYRSRSPNRALSRLRLSP